MISQKIRGLDTFSTEWKKSKNPPKASQGELKLGSQIIKFSKYLKLLNRQLSMHSTLWNLKKANSKIHALGRSVTIIHECGSVLVAHVSIMCTLQICLIRTNLKALPSYRGLTEKTLNERTRWNKPFVPRKSVRMTSFLPKLSLRKNTGQFIWYTSRNKQGVLLKKTSRFSHLLLLLLWTMYPLFLFYYHSTAIS